MSLDCRSLKEILYENGATIVGFADLSKLVEDELKYGISIAIKLPIEIVASISSGPNVAYYDTYCDLNNKLNQLAIIAAQYLSENGYQAFAQTTDAVTTYDNYKTKMPHKTVAVNAGLGWIGKSALFVTEQCGTAIRLTSVLTDAKLEFGEAVTTSKCGECMICKNACPGNAISGKLWSRDIDRDEIFNPLACRKKARELSIQYIGKEVTLCGKCIEVCPYTRKYIGN